VNNCGKLKFSVVCLKAICFVHWPLKPISFIIMKKITYFLSAVVVAALAACSTNNDVVSKNSVQKRKYTKGFYVETKGKQNVEADPVAAAKAKSANASEWIMPADVVIADETVDFTPAAIEVAEVAAATPAVPALRDAGKKTIASAAPASAEGFKGFKKSAWLTKDFSASASVYSANSTTVGNYEWWVYLLLILLVPFGTTISMYLYEGSWTKRVTVNLILTLLCGLPGLIHAIVIIFGNK
jgi:uncharacterized membrane protein YqaE (UPF0057 family)